MVAVRAGSPVIARRLSFSASWMRRPCARMFDTLDRRPIFKPLEWSVIAIYEIRHNFLTLAEAKILRSKYPELFSQIRGDLQMHKLRSDGSGSIRDMAKGQFGNVGISRAEL